ANHHLLAVLEEIHHPWGPVVHVRWTALLHHLDLGIAGAVGGRKLVLPRYRSGDLSVAQPRYRLDSTVLPAGLARFGPLEDSRGCRQSSRNAGPFTDRCCCRRGARPLTRPQHSHRTLKNSVPACINAGPEPRSIP